jgi:hypothetical protein
MTRSDHWRERTEALSTDELERNLASTIYGERKRDHAEFLVEQRGAT